MTDLDGTIALVCFVLFVAQCWVLVVEWDKGNWCNRLWGKA